MKKVITSILTIVLSIPLFVSTPLAANNPNNLLTTPYGTCTVEYAYGTSTEQVNMIIGNVTIPTVGYVSTMTYQFTHPSTGNFTVHTMNDLTNYYLFCEGGYLVSIGTNTFTFRVDHAQTFKCSVIVNVSAHPTWNYQQFYSLTDQVITQSDTVEENMEDMVGYVSDIDGRVQQIQSNTLAIRNTIMGMSGYTSDSNDNIATDFDTLISAMNTLNTEEVLIYEQLQALDIYRSLIYQLMTENDRYVQYTNRYRIYGDVYLYDHTKNTSTQAWQNSFYIPSGKTYSFIFYTVGSLGSSYNVYSRDGNIVVNVYERQIASAKYVYEFNIKNNAGSSNPVAIEFTKDLWFVPIWLGNANLMPIQVQEMIGVNYGDMYTAKMQEVISAINNMNVSVNNMTVNATGITYNTNQTQVTNSVTNYNTNIEYVYSVENNYGTQLDTQLQNYNPDNTSIVSRLTASSNIMATVLNGINGIELFTVPITVMLVGIVLLAIVG